VVWPRMTARRISSWRRVMAGLVIAIEDDTAERFVRAYYYNLT
jgi:hypothetical protein